MLNYKLPMDNDESADETDNGFCTLSKKGEEERKRGEEERRFECKNLPRRYWASLSAALESLSADEPLILPHADDAISSTLCTASPTLSFILSTSESLSLSLSTFGRPTRGRLVVGVTPVTLVLAVVIRGTALLELALGVLSVLLLLLAAVLVASGRRAGISLLRRRRRTLVPVGPVRALAAKGFLCFLVFGRAHAVVLILALT